MMMMLLNNVKWSVNFIGSIGNLVITFTSDSIIWLMICTWNIQQAYDLIYVLSPASLSFDISVNELSSHIGLNTEWLIIFLMSTGTFSCCTTDLSFYS